MPKIGRFEQHGRFELALCPPPQNFYAPVNPRLIPAKLVDRGSSQAVDRASLNPLKLEITAFTGINLVRSYKHMCENAEKCLDRTTILVIVLPFLIAGTCFAFTGLQFLDTLPAKIVSIYDRIFVVFLAFLDMGSAFAVGFFTLYKLVMNSLDFIAETKSKRATLKTET